MDILASASRHCGNIAHRLVALSPDRTVTPSEIKKGVLFVWAPWSVQSGLALDTLAAVLSSPDFRNIVLYIADNDAASTGQFMDSIGEIPAGKGETFWINNGEIVAGISDYTENDRDVLINYTRKLVT